MELMDCCVRDICINLKSCSFQAKASAVEGYAKCPTWYVSSDGLDAYGSDDLYGSYGQQ